MGTLLDIIERFFIDDDWTVHRVDSKIRTQVGGRNGGYLFIVRAYEKERFVKAVALSPLKIPAARRAAVAEYITRANYGLKHGNFEMDFSDGEVRYKTTNCVKGVDFTNEMFEILVQANLSTMDRYFGGMMKVVYGGADPAEMVARVEGGHDEEPAPTRTADLN